MTSSYNLVSILIPTYKGSLTLNRAIISCIEQSHEEIEVIVVDDNSPDSIERRKTESLMYKYRFNPKIIYVKHDKNRNGSAARNTGFKFSQGDYICLLDDDDYFDVNKIRQQLEYLKKQNKYMATSCTEIKNGKHIKSKIQEDYTLGILTARNSPPTSSIMIRRQAYKELGGFDETYRRHQDYEFLLRYFQKYKICKTENAYVHICIDGNDNRLKASDLEDTKNKFLEQFEDIIESKEKSNKLRKLVYSSNYTFIFFAYLKEKNYSDSLRVSRKGLAISGSYFVYDCMRYSLNYIKQRIQ